MSDSEEFLSAEEDNNEFENKTVCNIKKAGISHSQKENSLKSENLKLERAIKIEPNLEIGVENAKPNVFENDLLNDVKEITQKICNIIDIENNDSIVRNVDEDELNCEKNEEVNKENVLKGQSTKFQGINSDGTFNIKKTKSINRKICESNQDATKNISCVENEVRISETNIVLKESAEDCFDDAVNVRKKNEKEKVIGKKQSKITNVEEMKDDEERLEDKEDNWDFDDWSNQDKEQLKMEPKIKNAPDQKYSKTLSEPKKVDIYNYGDNKDDLKEKDSDETGWDDFDDNDEWIATNPVSKNVDNSNNGSFDKIMHNKNNSDLTDQHKNNQNFNNIGQDSQNNVSWNGWKPWGGVVTSLLSTATEGVTSLTTHVSQVLENSIGIPEPEELVKINQKLEEQKLGSETEQLSNVSGEEKKEERQSTLIGLVSGVTTIGNKVITGGLDTLEGIGKKTMTILQENDPLLLNKRRIIGLEGSKPNLSQVLREAKEKSEEIEKNLKQAQKQSYKKQLHFETLFDHYYGLVHLEALEMLSRQCDIKIQSLMTPLSGKALEEMRETLNEVKELCDLEEAESDDHDEPYTKETLASDLRAATQDFGIPTDFTEIIECWQRNIDYLQGDIENPQDVFEKGLRCLAETCALQMNKLHKIAELLIIKESHTTVSEADSLVQTTTIFSRHLRGIANKFCGKLNTFEQTEEVKSSITNIFLEVYNSTSYVQSAFKLFIPILQVGAA